MPIITEDILCLWRFFSFPSASFSFSSLGAPSSASSLPKNPTFSEGDVITLPSTVFAQGSVSLWSSCAESPQALQGLTNLYHLLSTFYVSSSGQALSITSSNSLDSIMRSHHFCYRSYFATEDTEALQDLRDFLRKLSRTLLNKSRWWLLAVVYIFKCSFLNYKGHRLTYMGWNIIESYYHVRKLENV